MNITVHDFTQPEQHDLGVEAEYDIKTTVQVLLDTFESCPGATLRLFFRYIDTASALPELTSGAHALVDVLQNVHTVPGHCVAWPNRSTLGTAAAGSSPRRQHGVSPPPPRPPQQ